MSSRRSNEVLVGLVALCLLAGGTSCAGGSDESTAGIGKPATADELPAGQIIFGRDSNLRVIAPDGSGLRMLARQAGQPAVSPDARRIAFVRKDSVWTMARDGSHQRRLTGGSEDITPAWSSDGRTIYFSRRLQGKDEYGGYVFAFAVFRVPARGGNPVQLTHPRPTDHGVCHEGPAPAPNGMIVAFSDFYDDCEHGWATSTSAIHPSGRPATLDAFDAARLGYDPAWSPDGSALAFVEFDECCGSLGVSISRRGQASVRRITQPGASDPAWSPDGDWIAYVRLASLPEGWAGNVWLVRSDGTGRHRLAKTRADERDPAWLPPAG